MSTIYLAGKAFSEERIHTTRQVKLGAGHRFVASDLNGCPYHSWPQGVVSSYSPLRTAGDQSMTEYTSLATNLIKNCSLMIGIFSDHTCYGSIAEMSYARAIGKPCYMWVFEEDLDYCPEEDEAYIDDDGEEIDAPSSCFPEPSKAFDTYGFLANIIEPGSLEMCDGHMGREYNGCIEYLEDFETKHICWTRDGDSYLDFVTNVVRRHGLHPSVDLCESPIEKRFMAAAIAAGIALQPQFKIERYRLDFADVALKPCVELDGHDSHKTKEQRTHDAARERWLQLNDWRVIRFTGSEIHQNVSRCVQQTAAFVSKVREQRGAAACK